MWHIMLWLHAREIYEVLWQLLHLLSQKNQDSFIAAKNDVMSTQCPVLFVATEPGKPNYDFSWLCKSLSLQVETEKLTLHLQKFKRSAYSCRKLHWQYYFWQMGWVLRKLCFIYSMNQILSFKAATLRANLQNFTQAGDVSVPGPRCSFSLIIHPCVRMSICLCCPHQPHQSHRAASSSTCCSHLTSPSCSMCYKRSSLSLSWMKFKSENWSDFNLPITGRKD